MSNGYDAARKIVARHLDAMFQELAEGVVNDYPQWGFTAAVDALTVHRIHPYALYDLVDHLHFQQGQSVEGWASKDE